MLVRTQSTVFRAYLEERARARLVSARVMHAMVTCTALTVGACMAARFADRMSIEPVAGASNLRVLVAPVELSSPEAEPLRWPEPRGAVCGGRDVDGDDDHSVIPPRPPRTPQIEAEPRQRRSRHRAPPQPPDCDLEYVESNRRRRLPGAARSLVDLGLPVPSPLRVTAPLSPAIRNLTPLPLMPEHAPDPSTKVLERTFTGQCNRHDGTVELVVDVDHSGQVVDARIVQGFVDDPQIDAIVLQTVKRWRFRPWLEDEAHTKRTTVRYEIRFEAPR